MEPDRETSREQILEELIEDFAEQVKRLAYTYVKNWPAAEDITQEVFISCYRNLNNFRMESSYKTWVTKITINKCKDYLKSRWYKSFFPIDMTTGFILKNTTSLEEECITRNEEHKLSENVLSLPRKYREVIILYYYEELKIQEISELTGINQDTVKTRLRRGKNLLRKKYEGVERDG